MFSGCKKLFPQSENTVYYGDTMYMFKNEQGFWNLKNKLPDGKYEVYKLKNKYLLENRESQPINLKKYSLYIEGTYKFNLKNGQFKTFSTYINKKNYHLRFLENYKNGNLDGKYIEHMKSYKQVEGEYSDGKKEGWWTYQLKKTAPPIQLYYRNDTLNKILFMYKNNDLRLEVFGENGIVQDTMRYYFEGGIKKFESYYVDGVCQYWKEWDKSNNLIKHAIGDFKGNKIFVRDIYDCLSCPYIYANPVNGKVLYFSSENLIEKKIFRDGIQINSDNYN